MLEATWGPAQGMIPMVTRRADHRRCRRCSARPARRPGHFGLQIAVAAGTGGNPALGQARQRCAQGLGQPGPHRPWVRHQRAKVSLVVSLPAQRRAGTVTPAADQHAKRAGRNRAAHAAAVALCPHRRFGRRLRMQVDHDGLHVVPSLAANTGLLSAKQKPGRCLIPAVGAKQGCYSARHAVNQSLSCPLLVSLVLIETNSKAGRNPPTGLAGPRKVSNPSKPWIPG